MTNNTTLHSDDEITKNTKEKIDICGNHLVRLKERGKGCTMSERELNKKVEFLSLIN